MLLLEMAASGSPNRVAVGPRSGGMTYAELFQRAEAGAAYLRRTGAQHLVFVAPNDPAFPVSVFAAAWAGVPLVPLNYRLGAAQLEAAIRDNVPAVIVASDTAVTPGRTADQQMLTPGEWLEATKPGPTSDTWSMDADAVAFLLYTSGTTSVPKKAVLRHRHLASYVMGTVEFGSAEETDAALVSMPPYHIAGISSVLTNVYAGRRIVALPSFSPDNWLAKVREEAITNAVVVPTMLARIVDAVGASDDATLPSLRSLVYGGSRMPLRVIERALAVFPNAGFVNAYGLTETSSTVAMLGPGEHRAAIASDDPKVRARLSSAGRVVPGIEVEIRDAAGMPAASGETGDVWLRGEQVSGEYVGRDRATNAEGWYPTADRGRLDPDGYLFIDGRSDDTIIRGGENIAPAEIEDVIRRHPAVSDVAVVGPEDLEWGQRLAAVVVLRPGQRAEVDEIREWVRGILRTSKTPDQVVFCESLPQTETGKVIRREVLASLR